MLFFVDKAYNNYKNAWVHSVGNMSNLFLKKWHKARDILKG